MTKFAVLIDADNSSQDTIEPILEEIAKYGVASVKRIYGDWSNDTLKNWKEKLLPNAITPVQQFAYVAKKDATDMKLVIDAMDLLYARQLDGFCIVSSDSDFTPLASRIRESGLLCYGFGKKNTVESFRNACDKFIYVENLLPNETEGNQQNIKSSQNTEQLIDISTLNLFYKAIKETSNETDGWADLGGVGKYINSVKSDFDTRTYGKQKLSDLLKSLHIFEVTQNKNQIFVKKFSFKRLNAHIKELIKNKTSLVDANGWAKINDVSEIMKNRHYHHLTKNDIEEKIKNIQYDSIEVKKDKLRLR